MLWWRAHGRVAFLSWALVATALGVLALAGCSSPEAPPAPPLAVQPLTASPSPTATPAATPTIGPTPTPTPPATPTASASLPAALRGFRMPIAGACLPSSDNLLPNAPRAYRAGTHEGVDFYDGYVCVPVARGMPVVAAKGGTVIRADAQYHSPTREELERLLIVSQERGYTDEEALDVLRGRQVWIDHGGGIVSRYAHLLDVAAGLREGMAVEAGAVIGYVGNTGILDGIDDPNAEVHLHFEIRVGRDYLGQGMTPQAVRELLRQVLTAAAE